MKTKTQMAFFQRKKPLTIRKIQDKLKKSNNENSNLNYYKISTVFDTSGILSKFSDKNKYELNKNNVLKSETIPQLSKSLDKRFSNKNKDKDNKTNFLLSNMNYFQKNINNIKMNTNFKKDNSVNIDKRKNKFYLKINNDNSNLQNNYSLPKINVKKNPMHISLDSKEKLVVKEKKAVSQRNIFNYRNSTKSKIIYKLKEQTLFRDKYNEETSLGDILNEKYINYQQAKHSENSFDRIISYGVNTYRGVVRNYNEDRVTILINALINKGNNNVKKYLKTLKISYFSIYDGHAGNKCCEFLKKYLHHYIFQSEFFPLNPIKAIEEGFSLCESKFMSMIYSDNKYSDYSGSCAIVILILNDICYIANLGDSRALYSCNDGKKFFQLSRDHKPNDPIEKSRIYKAGGSIYKSINNSPQKNILNENEKLEKMAKIPFRINPGRLAVSYFYHYLGF